MLSKYYNYTTVNAAKPDRDSVSDLVAGLNQYFSTDTVTQIFPGGTLGLFFEGEWSGQKFFLKSHLPEEMAEKNLKKEIFLMEHLYKQELDISNVCFIKDNVCRQVMIMDWLNIPHNNYTLSEVQETVKRYQKKLWNVDRANINYGINDFISAVSKSCEQLMKLSFIDSETYNYSQNAIKNFTKYSEYDQDICHGDLSNVNIVPIQGTLAALDWEDAMISVKHYDLLYWLTFYSQRVLYSSVLFKEIKIDEQYGKDVMVMILLVKGYLSYLNNSYIKNTLTIQDRLNEIIYM